MHISPRVVVSIRIQLPVPVTSLGTLHRIEKKQYAHSSVVCYNSQTMVRLRTKLNDKSLVVGVCDSHVLFRYCHLSHLQ